MNSTSFKIWFSKILEKLKKCIIIVMNNVYYTRKIENIFMEKEKRKHKKYLAFQKCYIC